MKKWISTYLGYPLSFYRIPYNEQEKLKDNVK